MKISINQPAYLPWLGYFDRIEKSDLHVVLDHVQFEKNSMVNRNKINSVNNPILLTVPVYTKGKFGNLEINTVEIDHVSQWQKKHWKTILLSYSKAPFFCKYKDELELIYKKKYTKLNDLLKDQLTFFLNALRIKTPILFSSSLDLKESKSDLILEICIKNNACHYISGPYGRDYIDLEKFYENNISVSFHDYNHPNYTQLSKVFNSNLSILDLIMNHGDNSLTILSNNS